MTTEHNSTETVEPATPCIARLAALNEIREILDSTSVTIGEGEEPADDYARTLLGISADVDGAGEQAHAVEYSAPWGRARVIAHTAEHVELWSELHALACGGELDMDALIEPAREGEFADQVSEILEREARQKGAADGFEDVETVLAEQGIDAIRATLEPGHVEWDEGAINAGAHRVAGISETHRDAYYQAYAKSAREHAEELVTEDDANA